MKTISVAQMSAARFPQALCTAQGAMHIPEVREMLRRLSRYQLGIFMPHMHDAQTGDFQALPDDIVQVESGLEVSFCSSQEMATRTARYLPVGWVWRAGTPTPVAACEMDEPDKPGGPGPSIKHKMTKRDQPSRRETVRVN